jgi:dTMP kinase
MNKMKRGKFIVIDGPDGVSKSTVCKKLVELIRTTYKVPVILTREPGGCLEAEAIRALLVSGDFEYSKNTELLLHNAARVEHLNKLVLPKQEEGISVLCDRYVYSTIAYQGYGHCTPLSLIRDAHKMFCNNIFPDLTILLTASKDTIKSRQNAKSNNTEDRYERMPEGFQDRVYHGYMRMLHNIKTEFPTSNGQLVEVSAEGTPDEVMDRVCAALEESKIFED